MKVRVWTMTRRALWGCAILLAAALLALSGCGKAADKPLEITGVFPADGGEAVPDDTAVEVTFSAPPEKIDDFFTIEPAVEGSFRYLENTVVFIPDRGWEKGWQYDTRYTVTVKAGLGAEGGKGKLLEDRSFSFTIWQEESCGYAMRHKSETFLPGDLPVADIRLTGWGVREIAETESYTVTVHRLESGERYLRELYRASFLPGGVRVETDGLTQVLEFTQEAAGLLDGSASQLDIVFPETLEAGWYVATVTPSGQPGQPVQKLLQIQESAVYIQTGREEALLWYNSTKTGAPVERPRLEVFQDPYRTMEPAITVEGDENGVAVLDLTQIDPEDPAWTGGEDSDTRVPCPPYALTAGDGTVYYDLLNLYSFGTELTLDQQYYGFLYTDRPIYRQADTVKFWGVARPRKDAEKLSQVQVNLYHGWGDDPLLTQTVPVSPDGVFTGEFSYGSIASGSITLRVYPEDWEEQRNIYRSAICSEGADIAQYKKPIYTASLSSDKLYYQPGETVQAQVEVSLLDRTPAAGMTMVVSTEGGGEQEYVTDEKGLIRFSFPAQLEEDPYRRSWHPQDRFFSAENGDASDVDLSVRDEVYIFPTTVMMTAEEVRRDGKSDVVVTAHEIDFGKLPGGRQMIQDYDALRGDPAQINVTARLMKVSYERVELAPFYDRYTKKSIARYSYTRKETEVETVTRSTGAEGTFTLENILPPAGEREYYYLELTTRDGGSQTTTLVLGNPWVCAPEEREGKFHTFQVRTSLNETSKNVSYWGANFRYGEEARFQVMENGLPLESGTVMTSLLQHGLLEAPKTGGTAGTIPCTEEKLPNFTLCGAYFDGTRIYPIHPFTMDVDPESRALKLEVLPEQEDYQPGDTASVTLRLTDQSGKPVSGASVCVGVVDEAIFAVREQYFQMGYELYRAVFYSYPEVTASYVQHGADLYYGEGGKGGGGGGDGVTIRENFKDTAGFLTGTTGPDGTAAFTVELPENLTQWRLTAVALDQNAWWGCSRSRLYTTLPFRIDPILSSTFLSGDTIACTVRGFGTGIGTTDPVSYTASIQGYGEELTAEAEALAGDITPLVFRKLPAGEYTMTVTAACGEYSDGVKVPFTVRDSALTFPVHKTAALENGLGGIEPTLYPVDLSIYHEGQKSFMEAWSLLWRDDSGRGDARLAKAAVREVMSAWFGEGYTPPEMDLVGIQTSWADEDRGEDEAIGGIRLYPYAQADPATSARTAVAAPELVEQSELAGYLHDLFDRSGDREEQAAALMGLAALEGINDEQKVVLQSRAGDSQLPVRESEYLIAGLSYLDPSAAQKLYSQQIAPKLREERGGLCVQGDTPYETVDSTAGALACAILTGASDDAERIIGYLAENSVTRYGTMRGPCQLEAALYLKRFQLKEEQLPTISYTLDGERRTETLSWDSCRSLSLTEAQWKALDLRSEGGPALASVWYTGTPEELSLEDSPRIAVTKTMDTPEDQKHLGGETTVTIRVELDSSLPYGSYRLVEWIPSNMRLRRVVENDKKPFTYRSEEQLLTVDFSYGPLVPGSRVFTFQYTATSVLDTECTLERTYVYHPETMECGRTEKGEFLPSDYYYLGVGYLFRKE